MMEALFSGKERKCMWNRSYNVIMRTPIGARYGTVSVTVDNSTISGMLDILKKANPFHGNINKKGDCRIKGELTTLMRTIPYNATDVYKRQPMRFWISFA